MPLHPEHRLTGVILALLIGLPVAHGQDSGSESTTAPVELVADSVEVDDAGGISIYRGDVVLTRGTLRISGDVMRVYANDDGQLERVTVEGDPATYQRTLADAATRRAEAPRMEYFAAGSERLVLQKRGGDDDDNGDDGGRVNVTITPASE